MLKPHYLEIKDQSATHANHIANNVETHFSIEIAADSLNHSTIIDQHRLIYSLLQEEFAHGLHAISIKVITHTVDTPSIAIDSR